MLLLGQNSALGPRSVCGSNRKYVTIATEHILSSSAYICMHTTGMSLVIHISDPPQAYTAQQIHRTLAKSQPFHVVSGT